MHGICRLNDPSLFPCSCCCLWLWKELWTSWKLILGAENLDLSICHGWEKGGQLRGQRMALRSWWSQRGLHCLKCDCLWSAKSGEVWRCRVCCSFHRICQNPPVIGLFFSYELYILAMFPWFGTFPLWHQRTHFKIRARIWSKDQGVWAWKI